MINLHLPSFIAQHVTGRPESMFLPDLRTYQGELARAIDGKSVLVIGGAGSIGSSFIKALLRYYPSRLYVVDTNENGLTELTRDLRSSEGYHIPEDYKTYPINFGDAVFAKLVRQQGPFHIVANFAAHKHVRSEKDHYSIEAMIENNVLRTYKLVELLTEQPPDHFFCVSTDKAANPVNVMGASKKLMEEVLLAFSERMSITTARFANVAFSNGSLLDGFLFRLLKGQPLSAPNDVRRYFVSPEESGQLCLLACCLGKPGEIFFPKLREEEMKTFSHIGTALLSELGYEATPAPSESEARAQAAAWTSEDNRYPVYYFATDTSGEKSYEEFFTEAEQVDLSRFSALGVITHTDRRAIHDLHEVIARLRERVSDSQTNKAAIVGLLQELIPNFAHVETGRNLDQKM